jgi:hypothetical protein
MKITTVFTILLICLLASYQTRLLKKKVKAGAAKCTIGPADDKSDQVYPSDYQMTEAGANAKAQNIAARGMFIRPNDQIKALVKNIANGFTKLIDPSIKGTLKQIDFMHIKVNRQISEPLNIEEGAKSGRLMDYLIKPKVDGVDPTYAYIVALIYDIKEKGIIDPKIRNHMLNMAGIMGWVGDLGQAMFDYTKDMKDDHNKKVFDAIKATVVPQKEQANFQTLINSARENLGGDAITNVHKKKERGTCSNFPTAATSSPRSGLFDLNQNAEIDKTFTDSYIAKSTYVFALKWPWQQVPKILVDSCKAEPFAGHYSGSIIEIITLIDILTGESYDTIRKYANAKINTAKDPSLNTPARREKAAFASAFIIGLGYHSAIEVLPTVAAYLGTFNIRPKCLNGAVCEQGNTCSWKDTKQNVHTPTADINKLIRELSWNY